MGIDARMAVVTSYPFTSDEADQLSKMMKEAFERFHGEDEYFGVSVADEFLREEVGAVSKETTVLEIGLGLDRFYGTHYERGPILKHLLIAEWLEVIIPDCQVWYGGDDFIWRFTKAERDEIFKHYCLFCERPYRWEGPEPREDRYKNPNKIFKIGCGKIKERE